MALVSAFDPKADISYDGLAEPERCGHATMHQQVTTRIIDCAFESAKARKWIELESDKRD